MAERNFCLESGCQGLCCQNIDFEATLFERRRLFSKISRVNTLRELEKTGRGVFYARLRRRHLGNTGFNLISINGTCPNRLDDGSCDVHAEREHAARNFKIGCGECNDIRIEHGLAPIPTKQVE